MENLYRKRVSTDLFYMNLDSKSKWVFEKIQKGIDVLIKHLVYQRQECILDIIHESLNRITATVITSWKASQT